MTAPCFPGRTLLLSGASGGISQAIARRFFACGGNLVLADLNTAGLEAFADSLPGAGERVAIMAMDVGDPAASNEVAQLCVERFGGIDVVVPGAGIYPERSVAEMSEVEWRKVMTVNLDGVFHFCRAAIPHLREGSAIVTIASLAAHRGSFRHAHYSASKGGVISFTRSLALELAPRTRVNAVSPGIIDTPMVGGLMAAKGTQILEQTPLQRLGRCEEVAAAVLFLAGDGASFITGEILHVNGGLYMD